MTTTGGAMEVFSYRFSFHEMKITRSRLESLIGYEPGAASGALPRIIDETLSLVPDHCAIQGGFIIKNDPGFDGDARRLSLGMVTFDLQEIVYNQVKKSEKIAVFVCTSGPGISEWSTKLMAEGDLTTGYIVDMIGSEIVETAMD
ncbi:MAG: hypothetical protein E4G96_07965, partial [Chrysiogenales bacterium]